MKRVVFSIILIFAMIASVSCAKQTTDQQITGVVWPSGTTNLKLSDTRRCNDCTIKGSSSNPSANYYITPEGFDWDELEEKGYKMKITVTYDVYYKKDWDLGLGYAGSPKYDILIYNSDYLGKKDSNLSTQTTSQTKTFSVTSNVVDLKNTRMILKFSTENVQNKIYFKNIKVDYYCYK